MLLRVCAQNVVQDAQVRVTQVLCRLDKIPDSAKVGAKLHHR